MPGGVNKPFRTEARFVVGPETLDTLRAASSPSAKFTYLTQTEKARIHTLKGVPGKHLDVLLPDVLPGGLALALEIGLKLGSYDGAKRWRIALRSWAKVWDPAKIPAPTLGHPGSGSIAIEEDVGATVVLARWSHGGLWAQSFPRLDYTVAPGSREPIFFHHWKTYYHFLPEEDVRQVAALWASLPHTREATDIVVLNRTASAALYDLATSLGWRKLTLRERRHLGLSDDSPQWHRADGLLLRRAAEERDGTKTGCGQHTHAAAAAMAIHLPAGVCPQCHELQASCHCS